MSMPGFTAELSLGKTIGVYRTGSFENLSAMNMVQSKVVPAFISPCTIVCGACALLLANNVIPGGVLNDPLAAIECYHCFVTCGHSA